MMMDHDAEDEHKDDDDDDDPADSLLKSGRRTTRQLKIILQVDEMQVNLPPVAITEYITA